MKHGKLFSLASLVLTLLTFATQAQVPGVPGAAAPAVPGVPPGYPPVTTIWQKLIPPKAKLQECKRDFCKHPIGKMFNQMMLPFTAFSGGLISECCPSDAVDPDDLNKSSDDPAGAAAKIKADEAGAEARRANMRYLGTVDCHYWPEAEGALIVGLRTDKNECVRWEAAISLGRGCCCTRKTIEALRIAATASDKDGNPWEKSERVRLTALKSLNHCLCCFYERKELQEPKEKAAPKVASKPADAIMPAYYVNLDDAAEPRILADAKQAVAKLAKPAGPNSLIPTGSRSVAQIIDRAAPPEAPATLPGALTGGTPVGTVRPVAAGAEAPKAAAPAKASAQTNQDLLHYFSSRNNGEPPMAEPFTAPPERVPPSGNRDLFHIIRNSLNGE